MAASAGEHLLQERGNIQGVVNDSVAARDAAGFAMAAQVEREDVKAGRKLWK